MKTTVAATMPDAAGEHDWRLWAGRALSGLVVLFLLLDGAMKLVPIAPVTDMAGQLGWATDPGTWRVLGLVLIASTLLYAAPRTSVLGAILLTAYLGGAVATHARIGSPLLSHTLFGVYLGVIAWAGLWLRDQRLRALLP
jgi:DoxX-like family